MPGPNNNAIPTCGLILLLSVFCVVAKISSTDSLIFIPNEPDNRPYDTFVIDSTIIVNDGFTYTTDSLAIIAILKANGWGMPIVDSSFGYIMQYTVDSISAKVNGRIAKLTLENIFDFLHWASGLSTPYYLPKDIGKLTALQFLDINANRLDSLPPEIGNLSTLFTLNCSVNPLTILPSEIGKLTKLKELALCCNQLTELPATIGNLTQLTGLELRDNNLRAIPPEIGRLSELVNLSLLRNSLTTLPIEIGQLHKLQYLTLQYNSLVSLPNAIGDCDSLLYFFVDHNQLESLPDSIVKLQYCRIWEYNNNLCKAIPCPVQHWLDLHSISHSGWRSTQVCSTALLPSCDSSSVLPGPFKIKPFAPANSTANIYDLHGRYLGTTHTNQLPTNLRTGIYFLRSTGVSGRITKQCVVR